MFGVRRSQWMNKLFMWCMTLIHFRFCSALLSKISAGTADRGSSKSPSCAHHHRPFQPALLGESSVFSMGRHVRPGVCPALSMSGACGVHSPSATRKAVRISSGSSRLTMSLRSSSSSDATSSPSSFVASSSSASVSAKRQTRRLSLSLSAAVAVAEATVQHAISSTAAVTPPDKVRDSQLAIVAIGLSHKNAKVSVRERLAVPESEWRAVAAQLTQLPSIREAAVLSTCNRFEVYLAGESVESVTREAVQFLEARARQRDRSELNVNDCDEVSELASESDRAQIESVREHLIIRSGEAAVQHLLSVAAGLDSIVLGEGQILAQVKRTYELCAGGIGATTGVHAVDDVHALDEDIGSNAIAEADHQLLHQQIQQVVEKESPAGRVLARLLNVAVSAGKRVRSETEISRGAVSISSAACEFSAKAIVRDCQKAKLSDCAITVWGAGSMARLLLVHLQSQGVTRVRVLNRSPERVQALQKELKNLQVDFEELSDESLTRSLVDSDVVYAATASRECLVDAQTLSKALDMRSSSSSTSSLGGLHIVDICVPRNVDWDADKQQNKEEQRVRVYTVDDLQGVIDSNREKRLREMKEAQKILDQEAGAFLQWHGKLCSIDTIKKLQEMAEVARVTELNKSLKKLSASLSPEDLRAVDSLTRSIVQKLLHCPMENLRHGDACRFSIAKAFNLKV
jgi:glutamyl-tRNA reductase